MNTKWYEFRQNNSGGSFKHDPEAGIGFTVWVEARNPDEASARAQDIGLYFDGVRDGMDCGCCGDRWNEPWVGEEAPTCFGSDWPRPGEKPRPVRPVKDGEQPHIYYDIPGYVHPMGAPFYAFVVDTSPSDHIVQHEPVAAPDTSGVTTYGSPAAAYKPSHGGYPG